MVLFKMTKGKLIALVFFAAIYVFLNLAAPIFIVISGKIEQGNKLERVSLYDNKKDEYQKKILEARKLFRFEPSVHEPFYAVYFGFDKYNAQYNYLVKCIYLNEGLIADFSLEELAGIIAHEFAHAEVIEKNENRVETREHWKVDVRAAELTNPSWVESYLLKFDKQADEEYAWSIQWLKANRLIFGLASYSVRRDYQEFKNRIGERLQHVRALKNSLSSPPALHIEIAH